MAAAEPECSVGFQGPPEANVPAYQRNSGCREGGLSRLHHLHHQHLCRLLSQHGASSEGQPAGCVPDRVHLPGAALRVCAPAWLPTWCGPRGLLPCGPQLPLWALSSQ